MTDKIIIVGGGFGGLNAALKLKTADADILLIDNFETRTSLKHQSMYK